MTDEVRERRRWGKAGVRLTPSQAAANDARNARNAYANRVSRERDLAIAHRLWSEGMVVPFVITTCLDAKGLYGPEVDIACLAEEPAVDLWEAGKLYPTWEQLQALAQLTGNTERWFCIKPPTFDVWTTLRFHTREPLDDTPPLLAFPDDVVARCPGTVLHQRANPA